MKIAKKHFDLYGISSLRLITMLFDVAYRLLW